MFKLPICPMLGCYKPILGNCPIQSTCWAVFMFTHCQCWGYWWSQENLYCLFLTPTLTEWTFWDLFNSSRHYVGQSKAETPVLLTLFYSSANKPKIFTLHYNFHSIKLYKTSSHSGFCSLMCLELDVCPPWEGSANSTPSCLLLVVVCCQDWYTIQRFM